MSFRKRNVALTASASPGSPAPREAAKGIAEEVPEQSATAPARPASTLPGIRPSPVDGRPTTSTGTVTLDGFLAGHAGLALGTSLLLEESGTTDFAGALLRYYAAEGVVQGHSVHVLGAGPQWGRELPGLVGAADEGEKTDTSRRGSKDKMKIAWRYERLGEFGASVVGSRAPPSQPDRSTTASVQRTSFCHTFDLTKRLSFPPGVQINFIPLSQSSPQVSPFDSILQNLAAHIDSSAPDSIHRLVVPSLLSPALYPPHASNPEHLLPFLHSLRSLLRQYPARLTAMTTLPTELYPRSSGLVRWAEILSDGVLELEPFPHHGLSNATSGAATSQEEPPQGMLKIHRLPIFHEKGGGGGGLSGLGDDLAFSMSRRKFTIKPFSLPPVEGDTEAQQGYGESADTRPNKADMAF
ncbi:MAG: hypothetical protein M1819_000779 [Sarea resinae]|nr:MAG: hypothetical protein M1819_000779 [Sarea resinae]